MTYDLEAFAPPGTQCQPDTVAVALISRGIPVRIANGRLCVDGEGFALEATPRGARLTAGARRGARDEHAMAYAALDLAGSAGTVVDRPTGSRWGAPLLTEWLAVAPLLTGRALAVNEERIRHADEHPAATQFAAHVTALAAHAHHGSPTRAFTQRLHDELAHHAARTPLAWPVACGLARLGDYARLEALARDPSHPLDADGRDAYTVAASFGTASLAFFERALGEADPNVRRAAAHALHALGDSAVVPLVLRALADKRSTVREAVLERGFETVMALPGAHDALAGALDRLAGDPNTVVRRLAGKIAR